VYRAVREDEVSMSSIDPEAWYGLKELGKVYKCSDRLLSREHADGRLKGAPISGRGDLRVKGAWALDWIERRAADALARVTRD
jgi:hypothetical protein